MTGKQKVTFVGISLITGYFALGLAHYLWNKPNQPESIRIDFEQPWQKVWTDNGKLELCCAHSANVVVLSPESSENHALRMEVNFTDPNVKGKKRAEIRRLATHPGDEYWYQFRLWIPETWKPSPIPTVIAQWHAVPEVLLTEYGRPPPMDFLIKENRWGFINRWDANRISRPEIPFVGEASLRGNTVLWSGELEREVWTTWTFHVVWSHGQEGRIDIWKDGIHIAERRGPNLYNDVLAPYFKIGPYVPGWSITPESAVVKQRVIFVDDIIIDSQREALASVKPKKNP